MVAEGTQAPDFELTSDAGKTVRLADLRGKQVVLYFYPKDDTPGCTKQACGIRDAWDAFRETGAEVFGVSPDGEASHAKFKQKYSLPFTLLADPDHELTEHSASGCRRASPARSTWAWTGRPSSSTRTARSRRSSAGSSPTTTPAGSSTP